MACSCLMCFCELTLGMVCLYMDVTSLVGERGGRLQSMREQGHRQFCSLGKGGVVYVGGFRHRAEDIAKC